MPRRHDQAGTALAEPTVAEHADQRVVQRFGGILRGEEVARPSPALQKEVRDGAVLLIEDGGPLLLVELEYFLGRKPEAERDRDDAAG
jgi:hypothetical protein